MKDEKRAKALRVARALEETFPQPMGRVRLYKRHRASCRNGAGCAVYGRKGQPSYA